ncbi:MAG TPA: hypothetical protein VH877_29435 [Polyangia bacterium]|jgi:hypothetical protein|nr:hypothetical protein [Polyangia bacterium]
MERPWLTHDRVVRCVPPPADPGVGGPPPGNKISIRVRHRLRWRNGLLLLEESTGYPASWIVGRLIELRSSAPPAPAAPAAPVAPVASEDAGESEDAGGAEGAGGMDPEEEALRDSLRDERGAPSPEPSESINQFVQRPLLLGGVANDPVGDYFDQSYLLKEEQVTALEALAKGYQLTPDQALDFLLARELWQLAQGWLPK